VAAANDLRENTRHGYEASQTMKTPLPLITLEDFNLEAAERRLCVEALGLARAFALLHAFVACTMTP
jgi:hypothetical protein